MAATDSSDETSHLTVDSPRRPAASTSLTVRGTIGEIDNRNIDAVLGETFGKGLSNAVGTTSDNGNFVLVAFGHVASRKSVID